MARAAVLCSLGMVTLRLIWSGGYGWFVQQRMQIPLLVAGVILLVLGLVEAWGASREERSDPTSIRRSAGPAVGLMLMLPLLVLIAVAPTGLGAAAAGRVDAYNPTDTAETFAPLPDAAEPPLKVLDFLGRAVWDSERSLEGVPVVLEGIVVNDPDAPDGFLLTRFMVSCCAADGIPLQVRLRGVTEPYADDTWVRAVVQWIPPDVPYEDQGDNWVVEAEVIRIEVGETPADPYESPY